jgi:hypothetical protein
MDLKESRTLGEGRGNAFIRFLKEGREGDCGMLETPEKLRELQRKLYQKAKQLRKPLEEDDRKAVFGKTERTV